MRRVGRPIGICVMRRQQFYRTAVFCNAVKLRDKSHHVREYVRRHDAKRSRQIHHRQTGRARFAQIVNHVRRRARIIVQSNRAFLFINAAADIENLHL